MTSAESTAAHADAEEAHGPDHVHLYEASGIAEGNARLPLWFKVFLISLFTFAGYYIVSNWNAQPSSARLK